LILTLERGNYCPIEHRQHMQLAEDSGRFMRLLYTLS
jgi:hypothetical protein